MKIQFASDLHLEFADNWRFLKNNPLQVTGDILILAGDIGYLGDDNYTRHPFWDWASDNYQQVIACMGNHEFYKLYDIATLRDEFCIPIRRNVSSYYNAVVHLGDTDFFLSTLWARISLKEAYYTELVVSDFRRILYKGDLLTFADFNREHERCLAFLKKSIEESRANKKIVVTHHVPSFKMQCPKFVGSSANGAFIVELEDFIEAHDVDYWIYGHSHYNVDVNIGSTHCLSNQLGYVFHNEHTTFDPGKYIEV